MIVFAREDNSLVLQASTRANEQAGDNDGGVKRDEHLEKMSTRLVHPFDTLNPAFRWSVRALGPQLQRCPQR